MNRASALRVMVESFVSDVSAVARGIARDVVTRELEAAAASPVSQPTPARPSRSDLGASVARVVSYLLAKPGVGATELRRVLGIDASEMRAIIANLVAQRLVTFKGNTRARVYFASVGATTRNARGAGRSATRRR